MEKKGRRKSKNEIEKMKRRRKRMKIRKNRILSKLKIKATRKTAFKGENTEEVK